MYIRLLAAQVHKKNHFNLDHWGLSDDVQRPVRSSNDILLISPPSRTSFKNITCR